MCIYMYLHRVKRRKQNCSEVLWTAQTGIIITTKKKEKVIWSQNHYTSKIKAKKANSQNSST